VSDFGHLLLVLAQLRTGSYTLSHPIGVLEISRRGGTMPRSAAPGVATVCRLH
jgi:hypothetical protein